MSILESMLDFICLILPFCVHQKKNLGRPIKNTRKCLRCGKVLKFTDWSGELVK